MPLVKRPFVVAAAALLLMLVVRVHAQQAAAAGAVKTPFPVTALVPTVHPPVPADLSAIWLAPPKFATASDLSSTDALARGIDLVEKQPEKALPLLSQPSLQVG